VTAIADVLLGIAGSLSISSLKVFNATVIKELLNKSHAFAQVNDTIKRAFFSHQVSLEDVAALHIQDGDGDNGFT